MSAISPLESFIALSAVLTGFSKDEIGDPLDPDQLASVYYGVVKAQAGGALDMVLSAFDRAQAASGGDQQKLVAAVEATIWNQPTLGDLARQITCLWYLGRWNGGAYVSDATYVRALAWEAMDAKAIGYSEFADQYWARPPDAAPKKP